MVRTTSLGSHQGARGARSAHAHATPSSRTGRSTGSDSVLHHLHGTARTSGGAHRASGASAAWSAEPRERAAARWQRGEAASQLGPTAAWWATLGAGGRKRCGLRRALLMKLRWYGASAPRAPYRTGLQGHRRAQSERFDPNSYI